MSVSRLCLKLFGLIQESLNGGLGVQDCYNDLLGTQRVQVSTAGPVGASVRRYLFSVHMRPQYLTEISDQDG